MAKFEQLKDLVAAVRDGSIEESSLRVVMDNDCSYVSVDASEEILYEGTGYYDVKDLWPLVFPGASVGWC